MKPTTRQIADYLEEHAGWCCDSSADILSLVKGVTGRFKLDLSLTPKIAYALSGKPWCTDDESDCKSIAARIMRTIDP